VSLTALPALRDPQVRDVLAAFLLSVADDELVIGHRHSEWTGFAPDLESDVALSSIAQEEMGHARLFYEQACQLLGGEPDRVAFDRGPDGFRNAVLVERPNGDWGFSIVRLFLYDRADAVRLEALATGSIRPLADLAATLRREERYHLMYGEQWLRRLAGTDFGRGHVQAAFERAWPEAAGLLETVAGYDALAASGVVPAAGSELVTRWRQAVVPLLEEMGLTLVNPAPDAGAGGRSGRHSDDLRLLLDEMTSVWRSEPGAKW
jgi:ring-1,2-phenylacetyl-CoA epoxidase subunit PaaC